MHDIEPFEGWDKLYNPYKDAKSPFAGFEANLDTYENTVYGYYISPAWDYFGSDTLYGKLLFAEYQTRVAIIELIGEWNDALHNDIMFLKRNMVDMLQARGIHKFILIGEQVFNFHASDDEYYAEWFEEVEEGWIALVNFRDFIEFEFTKAHLDSYLNYGGTLQIEAWRTLKPQDFCKLVDALIIRRLS